MGEPVEGISIPVYNGVWCNYILHSDSEGLLKSIDIEPHFKISIVKDERYSVVKGDKIVPFTGASTSLGTLFLRTSIRKEMDKILPQMDEYVSIVLK